MKRKAFTLIELLISIALFGLIAIFLFGAIDGLRKQQIFFQKKEVLLVHKKQILSLLRSDFDRSKLVTIVRSTGKDFDSALIIGSNRSLYETDRPYVAWVILKVDNTLVRLESQNPITLPLSPGSMYLTHSDLIGRRCEIFRIYDSPDHRLVYLKFENQSQIVIETMK